MTVIGRRWTGKREVMFDTLTGEYREALPLMDDDALRLQKALLLDKIIVVNPLDNIKRQ